MTSSGTRPVFLLGWDGFGIGAIQDVEWVLEDRDDSTNRLTVTTTLLQAKDVEEDLELIFKGRRFVIKEIERDRDEDTAVLQADEVQRELADLILVEFKANLWTLEQAMLYALDDTQWTLGNVNGIRFGRANFEDITRMDALKFLARHQDSRLSFDSLRRRVNITATAGTIHETVFTYGRQLTNIEKGGQSPTLTVLHPTGADGMTVAGAKRDDDSTYSSTVVEDYGYYTSKGISLADARARFKKEEYWEDTRYEVKENLLRDAQKRLAVEAYPQITYTLTAAVTDADEVDDFGISELALGDQVYVWDEEIDTKLRAEVAAIKTSSDASENQVTLAYLPSSLGSRIEGDYFGDSGSPNDTDFGRSGFQPRPSMPILEAVTDAGGGLVRWNGQDHEGNYDTIPELFGSVETIVAKLVDGNIQSPTSEDAFSGTRIDTRGGGISSIGFGSAGEFAVWFQMVGRDGRTTSEFSEPLVVEVTALVDVKYFEEQIQVERDRITDAAAQLAEGQEQLTTNLEELDTRQDTLQGDLISGLEEAQEWREVGAISATSLRVGNWANLITDPGFTTEFRTAGGFEPAAGFPDRWTTVDWPTAPGGATQILRLTSEGRDGQEHRVAYGLGERIQVRPGDVYRLRYGRFGNSPGAGANIRMNIQFFDREDNLLLSRVLSANDASTGEFVQDVFEAPDFSAYIVLLFRLNHTEDWLGFFAPSLSKMVDATLLVDGAVKSRSLDTEEVFSDEAVINKVWADIVRSRLIESQGIITEDMIATGAITAPKITATEELMAALGQFLRIEVGELASNSIVGMSIEGGTVIGATVRGALIETTSTADRGLKFDGTGMRGWDSGGNLRFNLSSSTGNMTATGTWRTEFTGNRIQLEDDGAGGRVEFYKGGHRGRIKLLPDVDRLEMVYNDFSDPDQERPNVGVEQNMVSMRYRSTAIELGGTSGSDQYMRFFGLGQFVNGISMRTGGRADFRTTANTLIGNVGQRPEAGTTAQFEVRAEIGPVRLTGDTIDAFAVYNSTTTLAANVRVSSSGTLQRSSSASRYKLDARPMDLPDSLLDISVDDWVDKAEADKYAEYYDAPRPFCEYDQEQFDAITLRRVPGVRAEEVVAKGGEPFAIYGDDGQLEQVMYDRLPLAQIQIEKRQRRAADADIRNELDALKQRVSELEGVS